jgi:hypothetical protein
MQLTRISGSMSSRCCRRAGGELSSFPIWGLFIRSASACHRLSRRTAGEDTPLELEVVIFRGNKLRFAREEGRASMKIAEVMVSMR